MSNLHPSLLLPAGAAPGGATVLRPDFAARRRAVVGSPAHLAAKADELFARMMVRRRTGLAKPGSAEAVLAALAASVEATTRPAAAPVAHPTRKAALQPSSAFVDPSAGLAALSAQLAAVTSGVRAP